MSALIPPDTMPPQTRSSSRRHAPWWLWVVGVAVVVPAAVPIVYLVWTVIRPGGIDAGGISASRLFELFRSTAWLVLAVTLTTTVLGVATAWLTTRTDLAGRKVWSALVTLPLVIPSYVGALAMLAASGNQGMLSQLFNEIGLPSLPVFHGFWAAWGALSLWNFSFVHLLAVPALRRMDPALEEAARGLGSNRMTTTLRIVLPQLRPAMSGAALLVSLYVLSDFGAVSLLRYETFTRAIYTQFRGRLDVAPALFLSGILVMVALVLVIIEQRTRGRGSLHSTRPPRHVATVALRGWRRTAAWAFLSALVTAALILPMATLGWWAVRGITQGSPMGTVLSESLRSASVSGLAALVTVAAALPIAILVVRYPSWRSRVLESVAWTTYSLPHLAVGLGFLVLGIRLIPTFYQSLTLLVVAYVAMFMPQAMASAQVGLRQVGANLEDASRGLGVGPAMTFWRVTVPLVSKSLLAGGALVFLTTMKELPATLLLRPTGYETLAVRIWSASSDLFYTQASIAALVLVGVSAVPLYLLAVRDLHD